VAKKDNQNDPVPLRAQKKEKQILKLTELTELANLQTGVKILEVVQDRSRVPDS
jgi:hypothetical protein